MDRVVRIKNRGFASNTYLYLTGADGHCLIIDPGVDSAGIEDELVRRSLVPDAVFATHGHFDHLGGAETLRRTYSIPVHLHAADERVAKRSNLVLMAMKLPYRADMPETFTALEEGFVWERDGTRVEVIDTPGHTPGSVILRVDGLAFTGDTIYRDDVFLIDLPEQDEARLVTSIERAWDLLPDDTVVYPGHGRGGTFGAIKADNAPLQGLLGKSPA